MVSDDNQNLFLAVESLDRRVRHLESLLRGAVVLAIASLAFRFFDTIPNAVFFDTVLGGTAVGLLMILLCWSRAVSRWMKRVGVPQRWCGWLVGALVAVCLASLVPIAMDWLHG